LFHSAGVPRATLGSNTGTLPMVIPATALQVRGVCFYRLLDRVSGLMLAGRLVVE
jgi:hypothetical protein